MDRAGSGAERRAEERAPIELRVEYRRVNSFLAEYTRNISKGGTFIATGKPLPPGTRFDFRITFPGGPAALRLIGVVSWVREHGSEPGMGVRFEFASEEDRRQFEETVERTLSEQLGPVAARRLAGK